MIRSKIWGRSLKEGYLEIFREIRFEIGKKNGPQSSQDRAPKSKE